MHQFADRGNPRSYGGAFDWLAKLTSNRRLVYVATGAGAPLIAHSSASTFFGSDTTSVVRSVESTRF